MKEKDCGALWARMSKNGTEYFSGNVEIDGKKHEIVVFKNGYKKSEKHPDYRIFPSKPREQAAPVEDGDSVPF